MGFVVRTEQGRVGGKKHHGVFVFKGIPYAAAPEGPLRFQAPAPREPWDGVRDATKFGAAAPQAAPAPGAPSAWEPGDGLDCLNLNVWTPDPHGSGLPIMVWIHGGLWKYGSGTMPQYWGATLAESGVVVVTLNYRTGFEGFGHLPGAPDNRGLLDQAAALGWVRRNISAFGGNPDAVTVFGHSAGAASIAHLMPSGLFRRAIAQSVPGGVRQPERAREDTARIAAAAGIESTLDAFAGLSPQEILAVQDAPLTDPRDGLTASGPVLDGELVHGEPGTTTDPDVDLLCGFTHHEFIGQGKVPRDVSFEEIAGPRAAAYREAYPKKADAELVVVYLSDALIRIPTLRVADAHAGGRTWMYDFAWGSAAHGAEIPFVFGNGDNRYAAKFVGSPPDAGFAPLSGLMRRAWTRFAATGDPGWPAYDTTERLAHRWSNAPADVPDPIAPSRRIWEKPE